MHLDSEHALKVLCITAPRVCERLIREGRVQANLRHANIVSATDVLTIRGSPALVPVIAALMASIVVAGAWLLVRPEPTAQPALSLALPEPVPALAPPAQEVGDARAVWLVSASGQKHDATEPVLPGSYQVEADFGGELVEAGQIELKAGNATLSCSTDLFVCRTL